MVKEGVLFCMGNPLLDMSANIEDDILTKYGLDANNAILAEEKHMPIYSELADNYKVSFTPGGATQNTAKIVQTILQHQHHAVCFAGAVGDDKNGKALQDYCEQIGLKVLYDVKKDDPTGVCACLINGLHRSLVTNLGAACKYSIDHLSKQDIWQHVENATFFYIAGFFITSSFDGMMKVAKHSLSTNKTFTLNFSAPFLPQFFKDQMNEVLEYADVMFGNETEVETFGNVNELGEKSIPELAMKISEWPYKRVGKKRTVVITQGPESIIVVHNGELKQYPAKALATDLIIDTNGAGDAFVGGFLSQFVQEKEISECVRCGVWAATTIIQRSGCTFPDKPDYK